MFNGMNTPNDDACAFGPLQQLEKFANHLNAINQPAEHEDIFYEIMSGALVWRDEITNDTPGEVIEALRFIYAYRTSLMLNRPRAEFKPIWDHALTLFPEWVGFRLERREPTPKLLEIYRRGNVRLRWCLRNLEREMDDETDS